MRVEQRRRLPPQQLQRTAAARLGGLVGGPEIGRRHAVIGQHQAGQRRGQAQGRDPLHEGTP